MRFLNWLKTRFLNISDDASMADDRSRYKVMLFWVLVPAILFLAVLGVFAWYEGESLLAFLDLMISVLLIALFLVVRAGLFLRVVVVIFQAVFMLFFTTLFALGLARNQSYLWYYLIPVMSFFFFGKRKGLVLSLSMMVPSIVISALGEDLPFYSPYPQGLLFRFFISYLLVVIMVFIFETSRRQTKKDLEAALEKLQQDAIHDGLTGLYNRRYMDNILKLVLRQRREDQAVAFLMADLDFFKQYNDNYGHQAGDEALRKFAGLLKKQIRRNTDYAFRYGGEEFAILLSFPTLETAERFSAEIIRDTESLEIPHKGSPYGRLTVSIGAAFLRRRKDISDELLISTADEAMYEAKRSGRNRFHLRTLDG